MGNVDCDIKNPIAKNFIIKLIALLFIDYVKRQITTELIFKKNINLTSINFDQE